MFTESLLEFEESLADLSGSSSQMLNFLDIKADVNRFGHGLPAPIDGPLLVALLQNHNYLADEATVCATCKHPLARQTNACCGLHATALSQGRLSETEFNYWLAYFENPYKTFLTLPHYTQMTMLRQGMPPALRKEVWLRLVSINPKNHVGVPPETEALFVNFQHLYNKDISRQINKDLLRTFPGVAFFEQQATIDSLLTILNVYANYDLDLGYCQGLFFLVGSLFYHLRDLVLTFHALCKIMECEPEFRNIFVPGTMKDTLEQWLGEFRSIMRAVDPELTAHIDSFAAWDVFCYQWWLSGCLINSPGLYLNSRIVDLCLVEGWKTGLFKISMGILLRNKPILMSFAAGDEEVLYQHLLNESKWGNIVSDISGFFDQLLLSFDDRPLTLPAKEPQHTAAKKSHRKTASMFSMFKSFAIGGGLPGTEHPSVSTEFSITTESRSQLSIMSVPKDLELVYSDVTSISWERTCEKRMGSFSDSSSKFSEGSYKFGDTAGHNSERDQLRAERDQLQVERDNLQAEKGNLQSEIELLRLLLRRACLHIDSPEVRDEISKELTN